MIERIDVVQEVPVLLHFSKLIVFDGEGVSMEIDPRVNNNVYSTKHRMTKFIIY